MPSSIAENHTKTKLQAGELVLIMCVNQLRTPNIRMIAAACGFDGIYIDLEHIPTSLETASAICVAALGLGITPIARISSRDPHDATRILDCGAQGVMVPASVPSPRPKRSSKPAATLRSLIVRPRAQAQRSVMPRVPSATSRLSQ